MSKRFGRNQRRRAREQLALADQKVANCEQRYNQDTAMYQHVVENLERQVARRDRALDVVREVLGPHFVALELEQMRCGSKQLPDRLRLPMPLKTSALNVAWSEQAVSGFEQVVEVLPIKTDITQLQREMHIRVTTPLGEGAIYISNTALQAMGKKQAEHYLTHVVAGDIAKYIVKQQGR